MNGLRKIWGLILAICVLVSFSRTVVPLTAEADASAGSETTDFGRTTLMIYMIGSDLEAKQSAATNDLDEIAGSNLDLKKTNVLVCAGGANRWWTDLASAEEVTLLKLTGEGFIREDTLPFQSMGSADCLAGFVNVSVERFPADHYILILWDHGNGPVIGYGKDFLFDQDTLTLQEMREAMGQTPFSGKLRLDWVGFDACLMASAELAYVWKDYADMLVSSQETEPGFGWDYSFLSGCGHSSADDLARAAADSYLSYALAEFAKRENYDVEVTLSVLDLSYADELGAAVNALFRTAAGDVSGEYVNLARARIDTRAIGRASTNSDYDLVDLRAIAEKMGSLYPKESGSLSRILDEMVVYSVTNTGECSGLSLFYPFYNKKYYQKSWKEIYRDLDAFPDYMNYLERYEIIWLGTDMKALFSGNMEMENGPTASTYTLRLTPEQAEVYASSSYSIMYRYGENLYAPIYTSDETEMSDGKITATFDGRIIYCNTDFKKRIIPPYAIVTGTDGEVTDYILYPVWLSKSRYYDEKKMMAMMRLSVDRDSDEIMLRDVFEMEEGLNGGKHEAVELSDWDTLFYYYLKPRYLTRDENGSILPYSEWPDGPYSANASVYLADHLSFSYDILYDYGNEFFMMINVRDLQGNEYSSELFPIRLAAAPEDERVSTDTVLWTEGNGAILIDQGGVTVELKAAMALDRNMPMYTLSVSNQNDYPVLFTVESKNAVINDEISSSEWRETTYADPYESSTVSLEEVARESFLSTDGRLRSLICSCNIRRSDSSGATILDGLVSVEIPEPLLLNTVWDETFVSPAKEQKLLDAEGVCVSLTGLEVTVDFDDFSSAVSQKCSNVTASLSIENNSAGPKEIEVEGIIIDGVFFSNLSETGSLCLDSGQRWYPIIQESTARIRSYGYSPVSRMFSDIQEDTGLLPTVEHVSDLSVCLSVDGKPYVCPVVFDGQKPQNTAEADGETIYRDEKIEILLHKLTHAVSENGEEALIWYLWIVNRGDSRSALMVDLSKDSKLVKTSVLVFLELVPGSRKLISVMDATGDGEALSMILEEAFGSSYRSEPVELPMAPVE